MRYSRHVIPTRIVIAVLSLALIVAPLVSAIHVTTAHGGHIHHAHGKRAQPQLAHIAVTLPSQHVAHAHAGHAHAAHTNAPNESASAAPRVDVEAELCLLLHLYLNSPVLQGGSHCHVHEPALAERRVLPPRRDTVRIVTLPPGARGPPVVA